MHDLTLITTIAAAFAAAWVLGLITHCLGLSTIVGYLLAGIAIGPYTPGFVGNQAVANQLAEVGVILLMFGVGLHFQFKDLLAVRRVAVPGAIGQSLLATVGAALLFLLFGWSLKSGLVLGMAMAVASTVVLLRVLLDAGVLSTPQGHIAVGWLIVEDIFTVILLVLVPVLAQAAPEAAHAAAEAVRPVAGDAPAHAPAAGAGWMSVVWALAKLGALVALVLLAGSRVVPWVLVRVAHLRSRELFTLTVLVLSITVAAGSAALFGASAALGAFLAGMVVGQSPVSHQAASDALPMRDAFAVLFFVSVGMLFNPSIVVDQPLMVGAALAVVLLIKPLTALVIVLVLGYSSRTALTVAIGLGQIGEFSFILSEVARDHGLMPQQGHDVLVAAALVSITLNPMLFKSVNAMERWLEARPRLRAMLNARSDRRAREASAAAAPIIAGATKPLAIIVGYGPVGRVVDAVLRDTGLETIIIDLNLETVRSLASHGRAAIYGDASRLDILEDAGVRRAAHLVITLSHNTSPVPMVHAARELNPDIEITVRGRYVRDHDMLRDAGANTAVLEEGEVGIELARRVMQRRNIDSATIEKLTTALRRLWKLESP